MKEIIRIHQPSLLSIKVNQNNFNKWGKIMVKVNLIYNGVSVNIRGFEENFGIGDYVIIVTKNKDNSVFNTVAKIIDYNYKYMIFDNSTAFESRTFKIFYSSMVDIYKITKERARSLLRFGGTTKLY